MRRERRFGYFWKGPDEAAQRETLHAAGVYPSSIHWDETPERLHYAANTDPLPKRTHVLNRMLRGDILVIVSVKHLGLSQADRDSVIDGLEQRGIRIYDASEAKLLADAAAPVPAPNSVNPGRTRSARTKSVRPPAVPMGWLSSPTEAVLTEAQLARARKMWHDPDVITQDVSKAFGLSFGTLRTLLGNRELCIGKLNVAAMAKAKELWANPAIMIREIVDQVGVSEETLRRVLGKRGQHNKKLNDALLNQIRPLWVDLSISGREIAKRFGMRSPGPIYRALGHRGPPQATQNKEQPTGPVTQPSSVLPGTMPAMRRSR